jgi:DNA-binding NtrC family response regulator
MPRADVDILIADGDAATLGDTGRFLAGMGYRVQECTKAESALDFALEKTFLVGLIDYRLGSIRNGLDLVESLQGMGSKACFVMVTPDVAEARRMRAVHLNIFDYLKKPLVPETLARTMERAIKVARKQQAA